MEHAEFKPMQSLAGRHVVIAGGTGAIGLATAARLAQLGARCALLYLPTPGQPLFSDPARLKAAEQAAALPGHGHVVVPAQITSQASLREASEEVKALLGSVHVLVNSAGYTRAVPTADLESLSDEFIDEMLQVNFRGVVATIRAFVPLLQATGDGLIVNISSIAAFTGVGSNLAYVAAKAGIDVVGDALARALAPQIRVVSVSPGVIDTGFVPGRADDFNRKASASLPLRRVGTADDVAAAVEACATTLRYTTGGRIVVDGGRHL